MGSVGWLAFLAAAGIGAPARYLLDSWSQHRIGGAFPWGTLAVNVTGCLLLGLLTGAHLHHGLDEGAHTVVGAGALGAFTTFSTFTYETVSLVEQGAFTLAARNVAANFLAGSAAASAGLALSAVIA